MSRWAKKGRPPQGFDYLEPTLAALEAELRESKLMGNGVQEILLWLSYGDGGGYDGTIPK